MGELSGSADLLSSALSFHRCGRFGEAERDCRRYLRGVPADAEAWGDLGSALAQQGAIDEARAAFGRALSLQPGAALGLRNLGRLELAAGDAAAAERHLTAALRAGENGQTLLELGEALMAQGRRPYRRGNHLTRRAGPR